MVPDQTMREWARKTRPADIESISVTGTEIMRFENDPFVIKDPKAIEKLVVALRQAMNRPLAFANRVTRLAVKMKPRNGKRPEPHAIDVSVRADPDCYGPAFRAALRSMIPLREDLR